MMQHFVATCFLLIASSTAPVQGKEANPINALGRGRTTGAPSTGKPSPTFLTQGQQFRVMAGDSITLPCSTLNTGEFKQAWKRGIAILTAGRVKVSPDERLKLLEGGYDLEIRDLTVQDAGDYVCQIATLTPIEITHILTVLVAPKIQEVSSGGLVEVRKGSNVTLECRASGIPQPNITWTRKNNLVVSGKKTVEGASLSIVNTNRHNAGIYMCAADNGVGPPVSRQITLNILYSPEIEVERAWVHSGVGHEAQLVCIVHAHPPAEVRWYRSTLMLETTERRFIKSWGSRHTLVIRDVQPEDFANYTCQADNAQGKTRQYILLSGKPLMGVFKSAAVGKSRDSYNISWSVNSYTPIEEFRLYFRKLPLGAPVATHHPFSSKRQQRRENGTWTGRDWTDVVLPAVRGSLGSTEVTQEMSYLISGLEPSTQYEARVQARNSFGWNQISDNFRFSTRGMDGISREPTPEPAILPEAEMRDLEVTQKGAGGSLTGIILPALVLPILLTLLAT